MSASPPPEPPRGRAGLPPVIDWHRVAVGGAVLAAWGGLMLVLVMSVIWS